MKRLAVIAILIPLYGCGPNAPVVPVDRMLMRLEGPWVAPPKSRENSPRAVPAALLSFRSSGELVEHRLWVIERPNGALYISSGHPHAIIFGRWDKRRRAIEAVRTSVSRSAPLRHGRRETLCDELRLTFRASGHSLVAHAGERELGTYSPVSRLIAPDLESQVKQARESATPCAGAE